MKFFDCNSQIGKRTIIQNGSFYTIDNLIKYNYLYDIKKAFVSHSFSKEYSLLVGNEIISMTIGESGELFPVYVVMPNNTGEFLDLEKLILNLRQKDVKMVKMFPKSQNYSISSWNCGDLFDCLCENNIPVLIDMTEISTDKLYEILKAHKTKFILCNMSYGVTRDIYKLISLFDNLYIESSGIKSNLGIEDFVGKFSANNIVFGSGMPFRSGGSAVSMILYSDIKEEDKIKIAHRNLERMLDIYE